MERNSSRFETRSRRGPPDSYITDRRVISKTHLLRVRVFASLSLLRRHRHLLHPERRRAPAIGRAGLRNLRLRAPALGGGELGFWEALRATARFSITVARPPATSPDARARRLQRRLLRAVHNTVVAPSSRFPFCCLIFGDLFREILVGYGKEF